jgi:hypothetical protein
MNRAQNVLHLDELQGRHGHADVRRRCHDGDSANPAARPRSICRSDKKPLNITGNKVFITGRIRPSPSSVYYVCTLHASSHEAKGKQPAEKCRVRTAPLCGPSCLSPNPKSATRSLRNPKRDAAQPHHIRAPGNPKII